MRVRMYTQQVLPGGCRAKRSTDKSWRKLHVDLRRSLAYTVGPRLSLLDLEIKEFIKFLQIEMTEKEAMKCDPLEFYTVNERRFPILAEIAVAVLSIPPSEAECERTFSAAGRVHTKTRNSLSGDHINQVVSIHQWLLMDAQNVSRASALRSAATAARASRFATLKLIEETHLAPDPADSDDEDDEDE